MDRARRALPMLSFCLVPILAAQQNASTQEVKLSSWNYVLPAAPTVRVETKLVEVGVVVRDHRGHPVAGFTKNDFRVYDEGKERPITAFSVDTSARAETPPTGPQTANATAGASTTAPEVKTGRAARYVALVFDDVHIRDGDVMHSRVAAKRFVTEALQPDDHVAIFTTSAGKALDFTADVSKLIEGIEKIRPHPRMSENGVEPCPRITPYQAYLIVSMDALALKAAVDESHACFANQRHLPESPELRPWNDPDVRTVRVQAEQTWDQAKTISQGTLDAIEGVVDYLSTMSGIRVMVMASSGLLAGTLEHEQDRIINRALAGGVVINSLDAKGLWAETPVRTPDQLQSVTRMPISTLLFEASTQGSQFQTMIAPLAYLAQSTGGLFFQNSNDLALGFKLLGALPEVTYRLGFRPDDAADKHYHKLKVKLSASTSYLVQARPGYFAMGATETQRTKSQPTGPQEKLDREVMATDSLADFSVGVTVEPGQSKTGQPLLWLLVHVDLKQLPFTRQNERQGERITFLTGLLDADGRLVTAKEGRIDLDLTEATFARLSQTGISAKISLEAPPGSYRLRSVVQEGVEGKITASSQAVEIR